MTSTALRNIFRAVLGGLFLSGMLLVATLGPASAQAGGQEDQDPGAFVDDQGNFDIDAYLAASTGSDDGCSPASAAVGDTVTCTVHGYNAGDTVTSTLTCGPTVVFEGPSTGTTFTFSFVVPDVPAGDCGLEVCGTDTGGEALCRVLGFEVVGNEVTTASLARTGSNNTGTLVGVGAALLVLGGAAVFGARRRFKTTTTAA